MKKVMFIILTMFIAFAVTNCSEDITGVATGGPGETRGPAVPDITLTINGTLDNSITVIADSNGDLTVDNGTAVFEYGAILTLAGIYTASTAAAAANTLTLTEPNGTDISTPYYVASFDATTNTATLTTTEPNPVVYTPSVTGNILTVTDTSNDTTISGYITEFDNSNNTLTLTNPSTNYIVNVDNNNALTITESNNTVITNLYVTSFDATTNAVTLTNTEPNPVVYTPSVTGNTLTVTGDNNDRTTGYIDSLLNDIPGILTVKVGDVTITIYDADNDIIEPTTSLTISDLHGQYTLTKTPDGEPETVIVIDPDDTKYACTDTSYTPIITGEFLQNIEPSKSYCLGEDIDLEGIEFKPIGYPDTNIDNFGADTFIGGGGKKFIGTLDGEGKTITGLNIDKTGATYIGLFAYIGNDGIVEKLSIENPSVKGKAVVGVLAGHNAGEIENVEINKTAGTDIMAYATADKVGGLVGLNEGTIRSSSATGDVVDTSTNENNQIGGLVGLNSGGTISDSNSAGAVKGNSQVGGLLGDNDGGRIENSYATGDADGSNQVGGLVGQNISDGSITSSYAAGNANGDTRIGGLVGENNAGSIGNSYATGAVDGNAEVGGLVGLNNAGSIGNSYATGNVTDTGNKVGGLLGENNGTITNSYFDTKRTEQDNGVGEGSSDGVTGYSTANFIGVVQNTNSENITMDDFPDWLFGNDNDTWKMSSGQWPILGWQPEQTTGGGGTTNNGFKTIEISVVDATNNSLEVTKIIDSNGTVIAEADLSVYTASFENNTLSIKENGSEIANIPAVNIIEPTTTILLIENTGNDLELKKTNTEIEDDKVNSQGTASIRTDTTTTGSYDTGTLTTITAITTIVTPITGSEYTTITTTDEENGNVKTSYDEQSYSCSNSTFTPIVTPYGLQDISTNKSYCIGKDIELTGNFVPIGYPDTDIDNFGENAFTVGKGEKFIGTLDGGTTYKITGLDIDKSQATYIGLFAYIGNDGKVENLTIENPSVKGRDVVGVLAGHNAGEIENVEINKTAGTPMAYATADKVGGLVGWNEGTITSSSATGDVKAEKNQVGGLVGWNNRGAIKGSSAAGDVTGHSNQVGGLVGDNKAGSIENSSATGNVTGTNNRVGGLVGQNTSGSIGNSYATGAVGGNDKVGGLVGENKNSASIGNSYATGNVTGTGNRVGGLLGENNGTITNSYFDTKRTEQENGVGMLSSPGDVTGYSTDTTSGAVQNTNSENITMDDFSGWLFDDNTWQIVDGVWPVFAWQQEPILPELANDFSGQIAIKVLTDGTLEVTDPSNTYTASFENGTFSIKDDTSTTILAVIIIKTSIFESSTSLIKNTLLIDNTSDLIITKTTIEKSTNSDNSQGNANIETETKIEYNFSSVPETETTTTETTTIVNPSTPNEYTAITTTDGSGSVETSYDGQSYSCSNSTFTPIVTPYGLQDISTNKNYCLKEDIVLTAVFEPIASFTGTLDGEGKTIRGLNIDKTGVDNIGLFSTIVGSGQVSNLTIENPKVKGRSSVGALAGQNAGSINNVQIQIEGTTTTAKVEGTNSYTGGLVGENNGTIADSSSTVNVEGGLSITGGLVGKNKSNTASITRSYATGSVTGTGSLGGLVGQNEGDASITDCYATGSVNGTGSKVGGLVGHHITGASITRSYATGAVSTSSSAVGGFFGDYGSIKVTSNYFDTKLTGQNNAYPDDTRSSTDVDIVGYSTNTNSGTVQNNDTQPADITESDFSGWNFYNAATNPDGTWTMEVGQWPTLRWQTP